MDIVKHNEIAWDKQSSDAESPWVQPVSSADIDAARHDDWQVILTPTKPGLASGGGQQVPIFAAAGARVTSFDNSSQQLAKDRLVAERDNLGIRYEQGDMADLSRFEEESFDLIFHPVSNVFSEHILPVWRHCARVLRPGGRLLSGFMNPDFFLFDHEALDNGGPVAVRFALPYADTESLTEQQIAERQQRGEALEFSHSLETQIGGQLDAGLLLAGFYEDHWDTQATPLNDYMPTSMATLAIKP